MATYMVVRGAGRRKTLLQTFTDKRQAKAYAKMQRENFPGAGYRVVKAGPKQERFFQHPGGGER
jgi:hypothetical protein